MSDAKSAVDLAMTSYEAAVLARAKALAAKTAASQSLDDAKERHAAAFLAEGEAIDALSKAREVLRNTVAEAASPQGAE